MAILSAKLGRAVYWMLRRNTVFDIQPIRVESG
jgi:hypothetical protein